MLGQHHCLLFTEPRVDAHMQRAPRVPSPRDLRQLHRRTFVLAAAASDATIASVVVVAVAA